MQTLFFGGECLLGPHHFFCGVVIELARVGFSNSYRDTTDAAAILRVTGEKGAAFFKQSFELKIKGDLIPEARPRRSSANSKPCSPATTQGLPSARRRFSSRPRNSTLFAIETLN
jgi:hypothetical protein